MKQGMIGDQTLLDRKVAASGPRIAAARIVAAVARRWWRGAGLAAFLRRWFRVPIQWMAAFSLAAPAFAADEATTDPALAFADLEDPTHDYWNRPLKDPFTKFKADLEAGKIPLDTTSEQAYVVSLLKALDIPVTSQMLLYSTTSLQLRMISPRNPRALYFNEDVYLGWVPGGKLEIVSIDPEIGGIFYIFDIDLNGQAPRPERATRCMNCHSDDDTRQVPGIIIRSVVPGPIGVGGTIDSFRRNDTGHHIPLSDRFGGWHLTGAENLDSHWGNLVGRLDKGEIIKTPLEPGRNFRWETYPVQTSDILPQMLHEHQAGFVNRVIEMAYRARFYIAEDKGQLRNPKNIEILRQQADALVRYLLFADEAKFPAKGLPGDPAYAAEFTAKKKADRRGRSLRDLNLKDRLFEHRCSYMIYSDVFQALPDVFKNHIYRRLGEALDPKTGGRDFAFLGNSERLAIREILRETLPGLPAGW